MTTSNDVPGELDGDVWYFPNIISINATGKKMQWRIMVRAVNDDGEFLPMLPAYLQNARLPPNIHGWIKVDSGHVGGKTRISHPTIVKTGKNIGRSNETNPICQALRDAHGLYQKQLKKSADYNGTPATTSAEFIPPMLSQKYDETIEITETVYVQRKYNGIRCVITLDNYAVHPDDPTVIAYSRTGEICHGLEHIKSALKPALRKLWSEGEKIYFDGEIYSHGVSLQDISGYVRNVSGTATAITADKISYIIYDCIIADKPWLVFSERYAVLNRVFPEAVIVVPPFKDHGDSGSNSQSTTSTESTKSPYVIADTYIIAPLTNVSMFTQVKHTRTQIRLLYDMFLAEKYEGAMVRFDSAYRPGRNGYHSPHLLKFKPHFDAEFQIVGYLTGAKGKAADALMITCITDTGKTFDVTPALPMDERRRLVVEWGTVQANGKTLFENKYLGAMVTVTFDEYNKAGDVPQRARTELFIRDDAI